MLNRLIYLPLAPDGKFLTLGVASAPFEAQYNVILRLHRKYGGVPDVAILEEFSHTSLNWSDYRFVWKMKIANIHHWDVTINDRENYARQERLRAELLVGKTIIKGVDLIKPRRPSVLQPMAPP